MWTLSLVRAVVATNSTNISSVSGLETLLDQVIGSARQSAPRGLRDRPVRQCFGVRPINASWAREDDQAGAIIQMLTLATILLIIGLVCTLIGVAGLIWKAGYDR